MIRQNLLVLTLVLLATTGCSTMPQNGCGCGAGHQPGMKPVHKQRMKNSKCKCRHCAAQAQPMPLFPGDPYGQMSYGQMSYGYPGPDVSCGMDGCSSCGESCGTCGSEMYSDGGSGMMHGGMMMQDGQGGHGCNCGHDGGSMQMPMQNFDSQMMPSQMHHQMGPGHASPLAPAQIFEAPRPIPSDGMLPPVPNDSRPAEGVPPATPGVDPVSWQMSSSYPVAPRRAYPAAGPYSR